MLDDEHDELPLVSVGSGNYNLSNFSMPTADVLASQRARERECERELRLLREQHAPDDDKCNSEELQSTPSNSSELDGELAYLEAADAPTRLVSVNISDLITQLITHLPESDTQFLKDYLVVLQQNSPGVIKLVNKEMLHMIEVGLAGGCSWLQGAVVCCSVWLCAQCLAGGGQRGRRTLHALLQRATPQQLCEVSSAVRCAVRPARLLLRLSDALRGPPAAASLAHALLQHALAQCEGAGAGEGAGADEGAGEGAGAAGVWRSVTQVQAAGRDAAAGGAAPHRAAPHATQHPHALKKIICVGRRRRADSGGGVPAGPPLPQRRAPAPHVAAPGQEVIESAVAGLGPLAGRARRGAGRG